MNTQHAEPRPTHPPARLFSSSFIAAAALVVGTIVLYLPTLSSGFVRLDDYQYVVDNPLVRHPSWQSARRFLGEVTQPSSVEGYYQPLTMLSLMLDASVAGEGGLSPFAYHATNVLLHALNTVLIFWIMRLILGGTLVPLITAAIFGAHPAAVESVAWISQRKTVLASLFAFACVASYLRYGRDRRRAWLGAAIALYLLGTLAKPTIVLLPLVLILLDVWPLRRRVRSALAEKLPFLLILLAMAVIAWRSQAASAASLAAPDPAQLLKLTGLMCYNFALYLGNIFWPVHLSPFRAIPQDIGWNNPVILLTTLGSLTFAGIVLSAVKWSKPLFCGGLAFALLLLPALGAIRFATSLVSDRFLYLPLPFLLLPVGTLFQRWAGRARPRAVGVPLCAGLVILPLLNLTLRQQRVWHDSYSLWSHVRHFVPELPKANYELAVHAMNVGSFEECRGFAQAAVEGEPLNAQYWLTFGRALTRTRRIDEAIRAIRRAMELGLGTRIDLAYAALAEAYIVSGEAERAQSAAKEADRLNPQHAGFSASLGDFALSFAKNCEIASDFYRRALEERPDRHAVRHNLASALWACGHLRAAAQQCEEILSRLRRAGPADSVMQKAAENLRRSIQAAIRKRNEAATQAATQPGR
ncbi:MAG: hypothetical protein ACE5E1_04490 [Phycisphaerae bacterium]